MSTLFGIGGQSEGYDVVDQARFYDVALDDQRFLMTRPVGVEDSGNTANGVVILVQNFFEELKARVPN